MRTAVAVPSMAKPFHYPAQLTILFVECKRVTITRQHRITPEIAGGNDVGCAVAVERPAS
jgi:hypothetical protein